MFLTLQDFSLQFQSCHTLKHSEHFEFFFKTQALFYDVLFF